MVDRYRRRLKPVARAVVVVLWLLCGLCPGAWAASGIDYIDTSFENASPLYWETDANDTVHIYLNYDQERASVNRATLHWYFRLEGRRGAEVTLVLNNFDNIWNGRPGSPIKSNTISHISEDGQNWSVVRGDKMAGNRFQLKLKLRTGRLYVARVEPYCLSDLKAFKRSIVAHELVAIKTIGRTVQGRDLEIIRVGRIDAPHRILLRARAHPWEAGGNWLLHGLIERLLKNDVEALKWLDTYCLYVMPMANKDGVARGGHRFNARGMDLNRKWDASPDPNLSPENHALEQWLASMIAADRRPDLAIDLHNDSDGKLHVSRPDIDLEKYLAAMKRFEAMLRKHTGFTEGSTGGSFRNPGSFGEGLLERFGITACVLELNANWIAGLDDYPTAANWKVFGAQMAEAFYDYFEHDDFKQLSE
jgi:hypothetical protein